MGSCVLKSPSILNVSMYCANLVLSPSKNGRYAEQMTCISLSCLSYMPIATTRSDAEVISFVEKLALFFTITVTPPYPRPE